MSEKIIFLDIDGVLATNKSARYKRLLHGERVYAFAGDCIARINRLTERTGAKFVLSTAWARLYEYERLKAFIAREGVKGEIIGKTTNLEAEYARKGEYRRVNRGEEIAAWIEANRDKVASYVVLDDVDDYPPLPLERWVHVFCGWTKGGVQDEHIEQAENVLKLSI